MNRQRKGGNGLPRRVYIKHRTWYFVPKSPMRDPADGVVKTWIRLASFDEGQSTMLQRLARLMSGITTEGSMPFSFPRQKYKVNPARAAAAPAPGARNHPGNRYHRIEAARRPRIRSSGRILSTAAPARSAPCARPRGWLLRFSGQIDLRRHSLDPRDCPVLRLMGFPTADIRRQNRPD